MKRIFYFLGLLVIFLAVVIEVIKKYLDQPQVENLNQLANNLTEWFSQGTFYSVNGYKMFVIIKGLDLEKKESPIIFMHGHPSSSFQYQSAIKNILQETDHPVILFDHIGYGFSEKPAQDFSYSVFDHADNALKLWSQLGIKSAHIVSHDYSNLVLQEIFVRKSQGMLASYFDNFFRSVTVSNGGIQSPIQSSSLKFSFTNVSYYTKLLLALFFNCDLNSCESYTWGPASQSDKWKHINLLDALHQFKSSQRPQILGKLFSRESTDYRERWAKGLSKLDIPCLIVWGDSDLSSPIDIVKDLTKNIIPYQLVQGATIQNAGHYPMIENPDVWAKLIVRFVKKS